MRGNERRDEIMRILVARRHENVDRLAAELGVNERTIRRDIVDLMTRYPLETLKGNGGCVRVAEWYHPHRRILSGEQEMALRNAIECMDGENARILREMLLEYGSPKNRQNEMEGLNVGQ